MRRTSNIEEFIDDDEQKPDFDDMMSEVQEEIEEHDAEDAVVSRAPELRKLSENIDKATNTWINATLQLESAIRKYNAAQTVLVNSVDTIKGKVDTINTHIDKVLENAPTKLQVSVRVKDEDWQKIQEMHTKQQQWMTAAMQKHIREVNDMFYEERKRVQERYKEYDGMYLGHYVQYFFLTFFILGLVIFGLGIFLMLNSHYHWMK
jgi:chromosome segregation ATPase